MTITVRRVVEKGGKGGGGTATQTPRQPVIHANTLRSRATARILEVLSEGPVRGLHYGVLDGPKVWRSVFLDDTPIEDEAGNFNFRIGPSYQRYGYPGQDPVPGYPLGEAEFAVGVQAVQFTPIVRHVSAPNITAIRYKVRTPALYETILGSGDVQEFSITYAFDYRIDGGPWINAVTEQILGKTMSPYERAVRVQLPPATTSIEIRIERISADQIESHIQADLFWSSYTEIEDGTISYDDTALVSVTVDAEEFPSIPKRAFLLEGLVVEIPTNYNPFDRTYTGAWDGNFYVQWTNNPAWVLYALLTNDRWGCGKFIDKTAVDKWSFYEAAVYNDRMVPNGSGGSEPCFTCNCVINTRQDAFTVLAAVASSMNAVLYWANGTVFVAQDRPPPAGTSLRFFGPADVVDGLFTYQGTDVRGRYTAAAITWNDPDQRYEATVELVQDGPLIAKKGFREVSQTAFGCTSRGQAIRMGRWLIHTSQFETEAVAFTTGLENADLRPGEVIWISDPARAGARLAGRLLDNDHPTQMTLDRVPPEIPAPGIGWYIVVTVGSAGEPDNPPRQYNLPINGVNVPEPGMISVGIPKAEPFPAGSMWLIHGGPVEPKPWRVVGVADRGNATFEVNAVEYSVSKETYTEFGWTFPPPPYSLIPTGPLVPPSDIAFREYIYLDGSGMPQFGVVLSWTASPDPRIAHYQVELSGPAGDYRRYSPVVGVSVDVPAMRQGEWLVVIIAFDNLGRRALPLNLRFVPVGLSKKPDAPLALYATPQGGNLTTLTWVPTGEIDVVFYWVKWSRKFDAVWSTATTSIARVDRNTTQITTPTRAGVFMVKAIDALGQESDDWAEVELEPQVTETSIFLDHAEQPDWSGDRGTNFHLNVGRLELPPPLAPEAVPVGLFPGDRGLATNSTPTRADVYAFEESLDLGAYTTVTMTAYVEGHGEFRGRPMVQWVPIASQQPLASGRAQAMASWVPLAMAKPLSSEGSSNWDAHIECRVSQDGVDWGDWFPLKSSVITMQAAEWRMVGAVYDLATTFVAIEAGVLVEVPLRNVQGSDVPLDGTGHLTVTYAAPFLVTPTVQLTARQSLAPGGTIVITESDRDHFKVEHRDATGAPHAGGSLDYFVQGYGGHA